MKLYFTLCITIVISAYLPYPMEYLWMEISEDAILVMGQACGCPCPNARMLEGELDIPDTILHQDPQIYRRQMNLVGKHPFKPFVFEIATTPLLVQGQIIGTDTILCKKDRCELAPEFEVTKWKTAAYFPRHRLWKDWQIDGSIFLLSLGLLILINRLFPKLFPWIWEKIQDGLQEIDP